MRTAIIVIIVVVLLSIPMQMILPFPYGLGVVFFIIIFAIGFAIVSTMKRRKPSTTPGGTQTDDTQFWVCPHCGGNTNYSYGKQYCETCKIYL